MSNIYGLLFSVCALSFLSACSDDGNSTKIEQKQNPVVVHQSTESTIETQAGQIQQSIQDIASTLNNVSTDYEKNYKIDEEQVNQLAKQLGKLARQAGEGAKVLEKTGQTLSKAIQEGFNEGYQKESK